jgi:hypothetical protein
MNGSSPAQRLRAENLKTFKKNELRSGDLHKVPEPNRRLRNSRKERRDHKEQTRKCDFSAVFPISAFFVLFAANHQLLFLG